MNNRDICETIRKEAGALFICTEHGDYHRIRTPYLYPDGDNVDLFCKIDGDTVTVTDLAETTGWLRMQSVSLRRSPKQNQLIEDTCVTHGAHREIELMREYRESLIADGVTGRLDVREAAGQLPEPEEKADEPPPSGETEIHPGGGRRVSDHVVPSSEVAGA